jgi:hypothetical protein
MEESKPAPEAKVEAKVEAKPEEVKETIGQVLEPKVEAKPEAKVVPEAAFLEIKKDNKELRKELKDLRTTIESGASKAEVSSDIAALGEKYGVDKGFLNDLASTIRKDVEAETDAKLKPLTAQDKANRINTVFTTHFDKAMAEMPEFAGIVNRDVIKTLSLDPANADKTFVQLIEETYGNAIGGKRTLETTTPRGGKTLDSVDFDRARRDGKYLEEVLSNPQTKKEYNDGLLDRIGSSL